MTMPDTKAPSLWSSTAEAFARTSDPISSQLTLASLGRDQGYRRLIWREARALECNEHMLAHGWTDDDLWAYVESGTGRRHQRNVIARTRGLMEKEGWFDRLPPLDDHKLRFRLTAAGHNAA